MTPDARRYRLTLLDWPYGITPPRTEIVGSRALSAMLSGRAMTAHCVAGIESYVGCAWRLLRPGGFDRDAAGRVWLRLELDGEMYALVALGGRRDPKETDR